MISISFSVRSVSCWAHVFVLFSIVIVTLPFGSPGLDVFEMLMVNVVAVQRVDWSIRLSSFIQIASVKFSAFLRYKLRQNNSRLVCFAFFCLSGFMQTNLTRYGCGSIACWFRCLTQDQQVPGSVLTNCDVEYTHTYSFLFSSSLI